MHKHIMFRNSLMLAVKVWQQLYKRWYFGGFDLWSLRNCDKWQSACALPWVANGWWRFNLPGGKAFHAGRVGTRVTLPGGQTYALAGVSQCCCWGHEVSDSRWPRAAGVCHLQMAICPSVERLCLLVLTGWASHEQVAHKHASRDVFFGIVFNKHGNLITVFSGCSESTGWTDFWLQMFETFDAF